MKFFVFIVIGGLMLSSGRANAQGTMASSLGVELGALYLNQSSGGDTFTALPMLNWRFSEAASTKFDLQLGGTVYKDAQTDKLFWISAFRVNLSYKFSDCSYSFSVPLGVQLWDGRGLATDVGLRGLRDISTWTPYLSEAFVGIGYVDQNGGVTSYTAGVSKWF